LKSDDNYNPKKPHYYGKASLIEDAMKKKARITAGVDDNDDLDSVASSNEDDTAEEVEPAVLKTFDVELLLNLMMQLLLMMMMMLVMLVEVVMMLV
jgi:hypothetical protein